jgi:hypothetical protein
MTRGGGTMLEDLLDRGDAAIERIDTLRGYL